MASEGTLATAAVEIIAELERFQPELRDKLIAAVQKAADDAEKEFKRRGNRGGKAFADAVNKAASKAPAFDAMKDQVERLEKAAVKAGDAQADAAGRVRVAEAELAKVKKQSANDTARIVVAEEKLAKARRDAARADRLAQEATDALGAARSKLAAEGERVGEAAGNGIGDGIRRGARKGAEDAGDESGNVFSRAFQRAAERALGAGLLRAFGAAAAGVVTAVSPVSTLLGGAAASAVALAAALTQAAGAGLSLGGVLGSIGLAAATVKIGSQGLSDAWKAQTTALAELNATGKVSADTQEKLDAALKNLAPAAAAVVTQLAAMAPAWEAIRRTVQNNLFAGVAEDLKALGTTYLPILSKALGATSGQLNGVIHQFLEFLNTGQRSQQISAILSGLNRILATLTPLIVPLAGAFLNLFQASLPFAQQLANVIASLGGSFTDFLNGAVADGSFQKFLSDAMTLAGNLFQLLGNIGSIVGSIFSAGAESGGGLLKVLRDLTGSAAQFLKSSEGQEALASFFGLISSAGQVLVGVFRTLQPLLVGISQLFSGMQEPIQALGRALQPVILQLSTVFGRTLAQLTPVLAQLVTALTPVVTILGTTLAGALGQLLPVIVQLVGAFAQILPSLTPIVQLLGTTLLQTITQLVPVFQQLIPVLAQFIVAFASGLAPVLQQITPLLPQLASSLAQILVAFVQLLPSLLPLLPPLAQLAVAFANLLVALTPILVPLTQIAVITLTQVGPALVAIIGFITPVITSFTSLIDIITRVVSTIVGFVTQALSLFAQLRQGGADQLTALQGTIITIVSGLVSKVVEFFSGLVSQVGGILSGWVSSAGSTASQVASSILSAIKTGLSGLAAAFRAPFDAAKGAVSDAIDAVVGVVSDAVDRISGLVSKIGGLISKIPHPNLPGIDLPGFANGGLVTRPTVATLGEGGAPEVVIPLTKPKRRDELLEKYFSGWDGGGAYRVGRGGGGRQLQVHVPIQAGTVVGVEQLAGMVVDEFDRRYGATIGIDTAGGRR